MNEKSIQAIGLKHFGEAPSQILRKTIGICNEVYELKYPSESYILRMNKEKVWIYGSHKFLPLFQKLAIKTPIILAEDYSKTNFPFCYQIQNKLEGEDLLLVFSELSAPQLKAIAREIALIYDKFNTLPYQKSFGGLRGDQEDHAASLLSIIDDRRKNILQRNQASKVLGQEFVEILNKLIEDNKNYLKSVRPKLYFDDMSSKNVMIHNGQFNGLVDLDFLSKGDYLEGIGAITAVWYGSEAGELYINEIIEHQSLDTSQRKMIKVYAILHLLLWTSEAGIQFNSNTNSEINWSRVARNKEKVLRLYHSLYKS